MSIEAQYIYRNAKGQPRFKKIRWSGKRFQMKSADWVDAKGVWHYRPGISPMVEPFWVTSLYRLPEVIAALKAHEPVWLVEGEKDADNAVGHGVCATTTPNPSDLYQDQMRWFSRYHSRSPIVVVADQDVPGAYFAWEKVTTLLSVGVAPERITVKAPLFPGCKDLSDHLDMGLPLSALREVDLDRLSDAAERYSAERASRYTWNRGAPEDSPDPPTKKAKRHP